MALRDDNLQRMWCDLESHRQLANQLAVNLHLSIATRLDADCVNKPHLRFIARHAVAHRIRKQMQIAKPARSFDDADLKLRLVQTCAWRYREIAAVPR